MRFLVWTCRVVMTVVIAAFVAIVFYLTHTVDFPEEAKAALNWVTVAGTAALGLVWPLMRRYWQALLLLLSLGVLRAFFGQGPGLSSQHTPLLTPFQSDFLWVSIGVVFVALAGALVTRAILSDRAMRAIRAASTVTTAEAVRVQTAAALQETAAYAAPEPVAPTVEAVAPPLETVEPVDAAESVGASEAAETPELAQDPKSAETSEAEQAAAPTKGEGRGE